MVVTSSAFVSIITSLCAWPTCVIMTVWGAELNGLQRTAARHTLKCRRVHQTTKRLLTLALVVIHHATIDQWVSSRPNWWWRRHVKFHSEINRCQISSQGLIAVCDRATRTFPRIYTASCSIWAITWSMLTSWAHRYYKFELLVSDQLLGHLLRVDIINPVKMSVGQYVHPSNTMQPQTKQWYSVRLMRHSRRYHFEGHPRSVSRSRET